MAQASLVLGIYLVRLSISDYLLRINSRMIGAPNYYYIYMNVRARTYIYIYERGYFIFYLKF